MRLSQARGDGLLSVVTASESEERIKVRLSEDRGDNSVSAVTESQVRKNESVP